MNKLTSVDNPASRPRREQSIEDCYLLPARNPSDTPPSTALLETTFTDSEGPCAARSSVLIQGARQQDELRVVIEVGPCKRRIEVVAEKISGGGARMRARIVHRVGHPVIAGKI